ncbi:MAG: hypothetical protein HQL66_13025 [Magnetococcales bacterium]|nr:hypothetical protein [Magnetococcales bacterium]
MRLGDISGLREVFIKIIDEFIGRGSNRKRKDYTPILDIERVVGMFLSGDKLWKGDSEAIQELFVKSGYPRQSKALDMESYGFGKACENWDVPWLVLKGISDFGDGPSKATGDDWQQPATLAATMFLLYWVLPIWQELRESKKQVE